MFEHSVAHAQESDLFVRVVVSTADAQIKAMAQAAGAQLHHRSVELESDTATLVDVTIAALDQEELEGRNYDLVVVLLATAPLRTACDIKQVVAMAEAGKTGGAIAVTDYAHPPHQALKLTADGMACPMWPNLVGKRTDALPRLCVDNGSTYAMYVESFRKARSFYPASLRVYHMPRSRSVDVDDEEDWHELTLAARVRGEASDKP